MELDSIQDSTRYVVSGVHHGSILPGKRAEMTRNVFLLANADIRGGVWANELTLSGASIQVAESVYARGSITIENSETNMDDQNKNNPVVFASCVVSGDSLFVSTLPFKVRFMSDIYAEKLNINNSIVFGNIFSGNAIIKNSIVLGGVFCRRKLELTNSMISTFRVKDVVLGKNVFLFFPFALSENPIAITNPVKALTFFDIYRELSGKKDKKTSAAEDGVLFLNEDDVFEIMPEYEDLEEIPQDNEEEGKKVFVISGNERILDTYIIGKHFQYNRQFLENLTLGNHYDPKIKKELFNRPIEELESYLWDILSTHKKYEPVTGKSNMHDLFERSDVQEVLNQF